MHPCDKLLAAWAKGAAASQALAVKGSSLSKASRPVKRGVAVSTCALG